MSDPIFKVDVARWVESAKSDPTTYRERQTAEIILHAIARTAPLNTKVLLKGGTLMGLAYGSPRLTSDIDLTASDLPLEDEIGDKIRKLLESAFPPTAAALGYADLVVKIHSVTKRPKPTTFTTSEFPALRLKVFSAIRGTRQEKALRADKAAGVKIEVDISFNEPFLEIQVLQMTGGQELLAYSLVDLIAEKYRAMLQQVSRRRNRRQDVYDLDRLIEHTEIDDMRCAQILNAFFAKCRTHHLNPTSASLDDPEIERRAGADWDTMEVEIGELPDFDGCFARVRDFYRNLPWDSSLAG